jgi:Protein of unknown function (DUF2793)
MPSSTGPNLGLTYGYSPGDDGWGVGGFNPDMAAIDTLVMLTVINTTIVNPPGSPANGDRYIIGGTGTGAWVDQNQHVAVWVEEDTEWQFYIPKEGWLGHDLNSGNDFRFNGSSWIEVTGGADELSELTDVAISGPTNGQVLTYNTGASKWENANASGGDTELSELTDVDITSPTNGQVLTYNTSAGKWENEAASGGDTELSELTDVQISTPTNGQVLTYNSGVSKWENMSGGGGDTELSELTDVDITSPANGQVLTYNSGTSQWNNEAPAGVGFISSGDWVGTDAYAPGDVVIYNGAAYLCYSAVAAPPSGAPTIDGSNGTHGVNTSGTITLTTTLTNDIICVCFSIGGGSITSVTSPGLTFTQRSSQSGQGGEILMWTALSTGALTGAVITFEFSGDNFFQCAAFGVNGATGFDPNGDLPLSASSGTLSLSTTDANDFIIFLSGGGFGGGDATPGGFTEIYSDNFDGQAISVSYQRVNAPQSGVSFSVPANYDLILDALAAPGSPVPNPTPNIDSEHWITQASGLYGQIMGIPPTQAGTGLSTIVNQGSMTITDNTTGITMYAPSHSGDNWCLLTQTAPSTPYTITMLISMDAFSQFVFAGMGWYNGTEFQVITISASGGVGVQNWNSVTSFNANVYDSALTSNNPNPAWMQITDDGTNVTFRIGRAGSIGANGDLIPLYTVAKSSGFLGGSGYTNICFGIDNNAGTDAIAALLSYNQTS